MAEFRENAIEWLNGQDRILVTLSQQRYINRVKEYAEKYPDEVQIQYVNEDGTILASMPLNYLKLSRPRAFTDEEKQASAERFRELRASGKLKGFGGIEGEDT